MVIVYAYDHGIRSVDAYYIQRTRNLVSNSNSVFVLIFKATELWRLSRYMLDADLLVLNPGDVCGWLN